MGGFKLYNISMMKIPLNNDDNWSDGIKVKLINMYNWNDYYNTCNMHQVLLELLLKALPLSWYQYSFIIILSIIIIIIIMVIIYIWYLYIYIYIFTYSVFFLFILWIYIWVSWILCFFFCISFFVSSNFIRVYVFMLKHILHAFYTGGVYIFCPFYASNEKIGRCYNFP